MILVTCFCPYKIVALIMLRTNIVTNRSTQVSEMFAAKERQEMMHDNVNIETTLDRSSKVVRHTHKIQRLNRGANVSTIYKKTNNSMVNQLTREIFTPIDSKVRFCTLFSYISTTLLLISASFSSQFSVAFADESSTAAGASPAAFDMGALASLASNLGSNPQIMSMVSSLLNPQKPGGLVNGGTDLLATLGDQQQPQQQDSNNPIANSNNPNNQVDTNSLTSTPAASSSSPQQQQTSSASVATAATTGSTTTPPTQQKVASASASTSTRNGIVAPSTATTIKQPPVGVPTAPTGAAPAPAPPPSAPQINPLGNLISSVLPNLGNLGNLSGLLGLANSKQVASLASISSPTSSPTNGKAGSSTDASASTKPFASGVSLAATAAAAAAVGQQQQPVQPVNSAQSVINQVIAAYVAGQIPNELIQLGLSGRVPPQIIELALSGQVPPQMIQMIITGQVPISTINAFIQAMQQRQSTTTAQQSISSPSFSPSGVFSTTRALFETLFSSRKDTSPSISSATPPLAVQQPPGAGDTAPARSPGISLPSWLMPLPIRMPSMPNVRNLGQIVGGTISNVASMF